MRYLTSPEHLRDGTFASYLQASGPVAIVPNLFGWRRSHIDCRSGRHYYALTRRPWGSATELETSPAAVHLFSPHPNLSDAINHNIAQSEIEGGVYLNQLQAGSSLEIQTRHRSYTVVNCGGGLALISGHPEFCPRPVLVRILGSNWGGSMLKTSFIGRSMHLEFRHPKYRTPIVTSTIQEIRETTARGARIFKTAPVASYARLRGFLHRVYSTAIGRRESPVLTPSAGRSTHFGSPRAYYQ